MTYHTDLVDALMAERYGLPGLGEQLAASQRHAQQLAEMLAAARSQIEAYRERIPHLEAEIARLRAMQPATAPMLSIVRGGKRGRKGA